MPRSKIRFDQATIPVPEGPLPVLRLAEPIVPASDLLNRLLEEAGQHAAFPPVPERELMAAFDGERLAGFVHPTTGETNVFPALSGLRPSADLADRGVERARAWAADERLFPRDDTRAEVLAPSVLMSAARTPKRALRRPAGYLAYVPIRRHVDDVPVHGPGTRAMVAVDAEGVVHGMTHRWRPATRSNQVVEPFEPARIAEQVLAQVSTFARTSACTVDSISLAYYDGGGEVLQPAYRFTAVVDPPRGAAVARRRVVGYVSIGEEVEPLPKLGEPVGEPPTRAGRSRQRPPTTTRGAAAGDPTVGRYVVRNDDAGWVTSANEFMNGLTVAQLLFGALTFTNSQYYWAEPRLYTNEKASFVNSVNVALTESHGNWGVFSTRKTNQDNVFLTDIPSSGYGPGAGGSLAYWIVHSCEVIPTATDETTSFDVWWDVFNGLHAALGYRTEMYINDHVTEGFAIAIGLGASVVPAWLQQVHGDDDYASRPTYHDGNRGIDEPLGRASAVTVYGHTDDTLHDLADLGRPTSLTEWWFDN